jgi:hypothetical protein
LERLSTDWYFQEDSPGAYTTVGWIGAFRASPSTYAVAAENEQDVAAAITFASLHNLRVVVKGTGIDNLGRSTAEGGSLLIWTHLLSKITWAQDNTTVTVEAGVVWGSLYMSAQSRGRYVQGGRAPVVGAAGGFTQGGGYGVFSKKFGSGADNLLAATVVLASGEVITVNSTSNRDVFWALRGGGGGTFGVVTSMTYRSYPAPRKTGSVSGLVKCETDIAFEQAVKNFTLFFSRELTSEHWGGLIKFADPVRFSRYSLFLDLHHIGLEEGQAKVALSSFTSQVNSSSMCWWQDPPYFEESATISIDGDAEISKLFPLKGAVFLEDGRWYGSATFLGSSRFYTGYTSQYVPLSELEDLNKLAFKFVDLSQFGFDLQLNKALGNGSDTWVSENTSYHPIVRESAAMILRTSVGTFHDELGVQGYNPALPHTRQILEWIVQKTQQDWAKASPTGNFSKDALPGFESCLDIAVLTDEEVEQCWSDLTADVENVAAEFNTEVATRFRQAFPFGSYVNEADYFEPHWQDSFWGSNYARLMVVKRAADPDGLFFCHHCVGSEMWDHHGNCRVQA